MKGKRVPVKHSRFLLTVELVSLYEVNYTFIVVCRWVACYLLIAILFPPFNSENKLLLRWLYYFFLVNFHDLIVYIFFKTEFNIYLWGGIMYFLLEISEEKDYESVQFYWAALKIFFMQVEKKITGRSDTYRRCKSFLLPMCYFLFLSPHNYIFCRKAKDNYYTNICIKHDSSSLCSDIFFYFYYYYSIIYI